MMELTKARQGKDELVVDFINRRRNLSLNYKDHLSEIFTNKLGSLLHISRIKEKYI